MKCAVLLLLSIGVVVFSQDTDDYDLGVKALENREFAVAKEHFSKHLLKSPRDAKALSQRGRTQVFLNDLEKAQADVAAALMIDPNCALAYLCRGTVSLQVGADLDSAVRDFDEAIRLDPTLAAAYNNRGNIRSDRSGDFERALEDYSAACRLRPDFAVFHLNRGKTLAQLRRWDESLAALEEAMRLSPQLNIPCLLARADLWDLKGEIDKAVADYSRVIELDGKNRQAYVSRASSRLRWGDTPGKPELSDDGMKKALEDCDKAIELDRTVIDAYFVRGFARSARARTLEQIARENNVSVVDYLQFVGVDTEQAIKDFDEVLRQRPQHAGAYYHRGTLQSLRNQQEIALRDLQKAVEIEPNFPDAYLRLARIYDDQKKLYEALGAYSEVLRTAPTHEVAVKRHEELKSEVRNKWAQPKIKVLSVKFDSTMKKVVTKRSPVITMAPNTQKVIEDTVRVTHSTTQSDSFRVGIQIRGMLSAWWGELEAFIHGHKEWTTSKTAGTETEAKRSVTVGHSPQGVHVVWVDYFRTGVATVEIDGQKIELPFEFREDFDLLAEPATKVGIP